MKYNSLVNILDVLAKEAPTAYKNYTITDNCEKNNQIRSRCLIHLFLMVRFGVMNFLDREAFITEGAYDGGIDGFYIDKEKKIIYLIQSKFRTNEYNFENVEISIDEILKMDIGRILTGEKKDENGNNYNGKILGLQRKYGELEELGLYKKQVIFLCNLKRHNSDVIRRLIDNFNYEIFDFEKVYNKLVFPLLTSTYYDADYLDITINLEKKQAHYLNQEIITKEGSFDITIVFVPTYEIAKIMSKYKNALLLFNPRNYLSLSKNDVNKEIRKSIIEIETGEFAIFNNGITIYADGAGVNTLTGRQDSGTVSIKKPQIINGGQTAYTLSKLFEEGIEKDKFDKKEVMLKIITPSYTQDSSVDGKELEIIKNISKSTNQQSKIEEADMRANDEKQIRIQKLFFEKFGLLYERKKGEFEEAISKKIINQDTLIRRDDFIKAYFSFKGNPGESKNAKKDNLFGEKKFNEIFDNLEDNMEAIILSAVLFRKIIEIEKNKKNTIINNCGYALKYGKNAVIYMYSLVFSYELNLSKIESNIIKLLENWKKFEEFALKNLSGRDVFNEYRSSSISDKISKYKDDMKNLVEKI